MKKVFSAIMVCAMCLLAACEKHDGIDYFKSKCVAELNGQTYIDQTPFTLSPDVIITPEFYCSDNDLHFRTLLRAERNGTLRYAVDIQVFASGPDELLNKEHAFERMDVESPDGKPLERWEYVQYCHDNKISYARVNDEMAESGTFSITSYDKENGKCRGTFILKFSEGILKGEFEK